MRANMPGNGEGLGKNGRRTEYRTENDLKKKRWNEWATDDQKDGWIY